MYEGGPESYQMCEERVSATPSKCRKHARIICEQMDWRVEDLF